MLRRIKKAVGEYNKWLKEDWRRSASIMLDRRTGELWVDCFVNTMEWREYHDPAICELFVDSRKTTMKEVRAKAEMAMKRWTNDRP